MYSTSRAPWRIAGVLLTLGMATLAGTTHAQQSAHLSLDDIDQLSRDKVVRQLKDGTGASGGVQPAAPTALASPLPGAPDPGASPRSAVVPRSMERSGSRAEPVTFVGAFSDATGGSVLYEMNGGVYTAHVGSKLMNGWTARRVDGFQVTVAEGRRVWTETIRGDTPTVDASMGTLQTINDLGGPLPSGGRPVFIPSGR
jgi:hypothetical protein